MMSSSSIDTACRMVLVYVYDDAVSSWACIVTLLHAGPRVILLPSLTCKLLGTRWFTVHAAANKRTEATNIKSSINLEWHGTAQSKVRRTISICVIKCSAERPESPLPSMTGPLVDRIFLASQARLVRSFAGAAPLAEGSSAHCYLAAVERNQDRRANT